MDEDLQNLRRDGDAERIRVVACRAGEHTYEPREVYAVCTEDAPDMQSAFRTFTKVKALGVSLFCRCGACSTPTTKSLAWGPWDSRNLQATSRGFVEQWSMDDFDAAQQVHAPL